MCAVLGRTSSKNPVKCWKALHGILTTETMPRPLQVGVDASTPLSLEDAASGAAAASSGKDASELEAAASVGAVLASSPVVACESFTGVMREASEDSDGILLRSKSTASSQAVTATAKRRANKALGAYFILLFS